MEETVPCPGCAAAMGLDQEVCEACRRPRDEFEIEKGRDLVRERAERRRRRPYVIARRVFAAVALLLAFHHRDFFIDRASALRDEIRQEMKEPDPPKQVPSTPAQNPTVGAVVNALLGGMPAPQHAEIASARESPTTTAVPARTSTPAAHAAQSAPAAHAAPLRIAVHPDEPTAPPEGIVAVYGLVYDMTTLQPISNAVVVLSIPPPTPATLKAVTDENGHYQLNFSPHAMFNVSSDFEFLVAASAPGYMEGQIEETDPPYLEWPLKSRLAHVAELAPADMEAVPLRHPSDETIIPLDLILVPKNTPPSK